MNRHRADTVLRASRARTLLAVALAFTVIMASACSDAPTEKEIAMADDGINPSIVSILVDERMSKVIQRLGLVFLRDKPGVTFQYTSLDPELMAARVRDGFRPTLWLDSREELEPFVDDPAAIGEPVNIGDDVVQWVVDRDYAGQAPALADFANPSGPVVTALCDEPEPCASASTLVLAREGIVPDPAVVLPTGRDVLAAVAEARVDTSILYRTDTAPIYTRMIVQPLPDPEIGQVIYDSIRFTDLPIGEQFQQWLATSPEAEAELRKTGFLPFRSGRTA